MLSVRHSVINCIHGFVWQMYRTLSSCVTETFYSLSHFPFPWLLVTTIPPPAPRSLTVIDTFYTWNHAALVLLWLACSTYHDVFKLHLGCSTWQGVAFSRCSWVLGFMPVLYLRLPTFMSAASRCLLPSVLNSCGKTIGHDSNNGLSVFFPLIYGAPHSF